MSHGELLKESGFCKGDFHCPYEEGIGCFCVVPESRTKTGEYQLQAGVFQLILGARSKEIINFNFNLRDRMWP